jgi:hypothetical protein
MHSSRGGVNVVQPDIIQQAVNSAAAEHHEDVLPVAAITVPPHDATMVCPWRRGSSCVNTGFFKKLSSFPCECHLDNYGLSEGDASASMPIHFLTPS